MFSTIYYLGPENTFSQKVQFCFQDDLEALTLFLPHLLFAFTCHDGLEKWTSWSTNYLLLCAAMVGIEMGILRVGRIASKVETIIQTFFKRGIVFTAIFWSPPWLRVQLQPENLTHKFVVTYNHWLENVSKYCPSTYQSIVGSDLGPCMPGWKGQPINHVMSLSHNLKVIC